MEKVSSARIALKWGLIQGILSIFTTTLLYNTDLWKNWMVMLGISFIITFVILYLALSEYKRLNNGYMSFGEGVALGTLAITVGGILGLVYDFCYKIYIDPNIVTQQLDLAREQYETMGFSEEQIELSIEKAQQYTTSGLAFILGIVFMVIIGAICSLIMSAILKKEKSIFD